MLVENGRRVPRLSSPGVTDMLVNEKPEPIATKHYFYSFSVPGEVKIKEINKTLRADFVNQREDIDNPAVAFIDSLALGKNIIVRSKEDGDRFVPLGMTGSKKLQDFFVDLKINKEDRDLVPIVESSGKIIWVGGYRLDDRAKVTEKTKKIIRFELI